MGLDLGKRMAFGGKRLSGAAGKEKRSALPEWAQRTGAADGNGGTGGMGGSWADGGGRGRPMPGVR
mgnify:CR=1 FL=1